LLPGGQKSDLTTEVALRGIVVTASNRRTKGSFEALNSRPRASGKTAENRLKQGYFRENSDRNFVDPDFGVELPMTRFSSGILASAEFLHDQFRSLNDANYLRFDRCTSYGRRSDLNPLFAAYAKHTIKGHAVTSMVIPIIDCDLLAFLYFELFSTVGDDRVHQKLPLDSAIK